MSCWTLEPFLQAERIEEIGRVWQTECPGRRYWRGNLTAL